MHAIQHFKTITKHRHKVIANCFRAGIGAQGLRHDLSKYSPTEFLPGCKYFLGTRSPNEGEREAHGYSAAWLHHKGRNKHHFEYWVDVQLDTKRYGPVKMPYNYLIEMFCDRVAASKIYGGERYNDAYALNYFLNGKGKRAMHPETSAELERLLRLLADNGEEAAFAEIKRCVKKYKNTTNY
ncbi:MAG: catalase [Clostridia bacterium]|nr:catalase [Clostridia bacterium]